MQTAKKQLKEQRILKAAEGVFGKLGFKNSKMEDIAKKAGITKVTVYSYFQSKENLYLAVAYKALQYLNDSYYASIDRYKNRAGRESVVALLETFMNFCERNYLYSEALLDYFSLIRSTSRGQDHLKLTDALKDSIYFIKLQDIHNLPFKLTVSEIQRGIADGSISDNVDPMLMTLHGWTMVVGYAKIIAASGTNATPLFNVSLMDLKEFDLQLADKLLSNPLF